MNGEPAPGYVVLDVLKEGSAYDVFDAWSVERHCRCVVKVPAPDASDRLRRQLLREGRLLARLNHPHLLRVYEVRRSPPLVASHVVTGATLGALLADGDRLAAGDVAVLGGQLASALRHLHAAGALHLDVKPDNVAVDGGRAVLLDLSLARPPGTIRPGTGTPRTMAPEQALGGPVGPAADVWGLGLTLYAAAAGRSPFDDHWDHLNRADGARPRPADLPQLRSRAPALRTARRRFPARLAAVVDACLETDPAARPSLTDVLTEFDTLTNTGPPPPPPPSVIMQK